MNLSSNRKIIQNILKTLAKDISQKIYFKLEEESTDKTKTFGWR